MSHTSNHPPDQLCPGCPSDATVGEERDPPLTGDEARAVVMYMEGWLEEIVIEQRPFISDQEGRTAYRECLKQLRAAKRRFRRDCQPAVTL